jgi:hypothetical protein
MKVQSSFKKEFQPIDITITCESMQDLYNLWHRTNLSVKDVNNWSDTDYYPPVADEGFELFTTIDRILKGL